MHLFDVDLESESWRESSIYDAGQHPVAVDTPWGRMGLSICYDLRFPDLYRALTNAGATILLVPSALPVPTGQAHRSAERRLGTEVVSTCRSGWSPYHKK